MRFAILALCATIALADENANPFGVMIGGGGMTTRERVGLARDLGVTYARPWDISIDRWNGRHVETEAWMTAGFKVVMTVRNGGKGGPPAQPASPPSDFDAYRKTLGEILDTYKPEVLCVENEENSILFYTGTREEYGRQLKAACEVAHERGVKCTNGGLVSTLVAALVWDHYRASGEEGKAADFLRRAIEPDQLAQMQTDAGRPKVEEAIRKGKALLAVYKDAGIDYVNFHWYIADTQALAEAVAFLRGATGLQPITNEIGQHDRDPDTVTRLLGKVEELGIPIAVWYSLDRAKSQALQEPDGTLRAGGEAFRTYMKGRSR